MRTYRQRRFSCSVRSKGEFSCVETSLRTVVCYLIAAEVSITMYVRFPVGCWRVHYIGADTTDLRVDWIEQRYSQNEAGRTILWVPGSKFMQLRTMWTTKAKREFMHEFMFCYCRSHCSLLHKFTSGYPKDASSGFIFVAKTGTLLLYPVYYEISGRYMYA